MGTLKGLCLIQWLLVVLSEWSRVEEFGIPKPSARSVHVAVFDPTINQFWIHGGSSDGVLPDLWSFDFDTGTWDRKQQLTQSPSPRGDHVAVWDSDDYALWLHGGYDGVSYFDDLWRYSSYTWTNIMVGGPSARSQHVAVWDASNRAIWIHGGLCDCSLKQDLWKFDTRQGTWSQMPESGNQPSARSNHVAAWDSTNLALWIHAGYDRSSCGGNPQGGLQQDLWRYDTTVSSNNWNLIVVGGPPARAYHVAGWDPTNRALWIHGGFDGGSFCRDLWRFDVENYAWHLITDKDDGPSPRFNHAAAFDVTTTSLCIHGGYSEGRLQDDLWCYLVTTTTTSRTASSSTTTSFSTSSTVTSTVTFTTTSSRSSTSTTSSTSRSSSSTSTLTTSSSTSTRSSTSSTTVSSSTSKSSTRTTSSTTSSSITATRSTSSTSTTSSTTVSTTTTSSHTETATTSTTTLSFTSTTTGSTTTTTSTSLTTSSTTTSSTTTSSTTSSTSISSSTTISRTTTTSHTATTTSITLTTSTTSSTGSSTTTVTSTSTSSTTMSTTTSSTSTTTLSTTSTSSFSTTSSSISTSSTTGTSSTSISFTTTSTSITFTTSSITTTSPASQHQAQPLVQGPVPAQPKPLQHEPPGPPVLPLEPGPPQPAAPSPQQQRQWKILQQYTSFFHWLGLQSSSQPRGCYGCISDISDSNEPLLYHCSRLKKQLKQF